MTPDDTEKLERAMLAIIDNVDFLMSRYRAVNDEGPEVLQRRRTMTDARSTVITMLQKYGASTSPLDRQLPG